MQTQKWIEDALQLPIFGLLAEVAEEQSTPCYVVGGYVRDALLGRPCKDIDIVVEGDGVTFAEAVAAKLGPHTHLAIFKTYGTAQIKKGSTELEIVGARQESYTRDSRNPIVTPGTLEQDLARRDFTINALAVSLNKADYGTLIDLFEGVYDLEDKIIATPLEPDVTFSDDPLRMFRAIRFATQLDFRIEKATWEGILHMQARWEILTTERIVEELNKIILAPIPSEGFYMLDEAGLLEPIFPELVKLKGTKTIENKSHKDNFKHTLQVLDNVARLSEGNLWLRWAALLHDIAKPQTQRFEPEHGWTFHGHEVVGAKMVPKIFKRLKLPLNEKMKYVQKLVLLHLRPIPLALEVSDSAIRRLIVDAEEDLNDLMLLCRADVTSKNMEKVQRYHKRFDNLMLKIRDVEERDALRNWKNPITGELIMETFGIPPSRLVGTIKDEIKEAIMSGAITNEFEPAFRMMLALGAAQGIVPKKTD